MAAVIQPPVFVFWDELLTFDSVEAAELFLEPWCCEERLTAYDREGQLLQIAPGNPRRGGVRITGTEALPRKAELIERLRSWLLWVAESEPGLLSAEWDQRATADALVEWCRQHRTA